MIKHIVLWRLKKTADEKEWRENALRVKEALEEMEGKIPGLLRLEVGIDFNRTDQASDVVLYSEFESREALEIYRDHPEHVKFKSFVRTVRTERRVIDYEV